EAVLKIDEAFAFERRSAERGRRGPLADVRAVDDVGAEEALRAPARVAHVVLDPDLALLAEAGGHAMSRADVLDPDRDANLARRARRLLHRERERVTQHRVA